MNYFSLSAGILIVVFVFYDFAYTSLSSNGAGPLTNHISRTVWKIFLRLCNNDGARKFLNNVGVITILSILFTWIALIWTGNSLIFCSDNYSIISSSTLKPATTIEKVYYVGYTLSTLGIGDFVASKNFWKLFSTFLSFTGLAFITIAISYLVPVLSFEIATRKLSIYIRNLGSSPEQLLLNHWDGKSFKSLEQFFIALTDMILHQGQNHFAYPILEYFHRANKQESISLNLVVLDEALTILLIHIPEENRPNIHYIIALRKAISCYLETLTTTYKQHIIIADEKLSIPSLTVLKEAKVPLLNDVEQIIGHYNRLESRRSLLLSLLHNHGWKWEDLHKGYGDKIVTKYK